MEGGHRFHRGYRSPFLLRQTTLADGSHFGCGRRAAKVTEGRAASSKALPTQGNHLKSVVCLFRPIACKVIDLNPDCVFLIAYQAQKLIDEILERSLEMVRDPERVPDESQQMNDDGVRLFTKSSKGIVFNRLGMARDIKKNSPLFGILNSYMGPDFVVN